MIRRKWLALPLLVLGLAATTPVPSLAGITVQIGPPPPKVVAPPPARSGYVWAPGYWDWDGAQYVWKEGRWESERKGYRWREQRWIERNGSWVAEPGMWEPIDGPVPPPPPPPR